MKQKSAVEWLVSQLNKKGFAQVVTDEEIEQAKEMEKQQMWNYIETNYVIGENSLLFHKQEFEQYYEMTYGK
jgi:predicted GNAT family acetyltransferase